MKETSISLSHPACSSPGIIQLPATLLVARAALAVACMVVLSACPSDAPPGKKSAFGGDAQTSMAVALESNDNLVPMTKLYPPGLTGGAVPAASVPAAPVCTTPMSHGH